MTWTSSHLSTAEIVLVHCMITLELLVPKCQCIWQVNKVANILRHPLKIGVLGLKSHRPVLSQRTIPVTTQYNGGINK